MNYREFLNKIGSDVYSAAAEELYNKAMANGELLIPLKLERVAELFEEISDVVFSAAEQISQNDIWLRYSNFLRLCYFSLNSGEIPLLSPTEDNIPRNFSPVFALMWYVDDAISQMNERGILPEQQAIVNGEYKKLLLTHKKQFGYYAIRPAHFWWAKHFLHPDIFTLGSLQFEITKMYKGEAVFKNITNGKVVALYETEETNYEYIGFSLSRGGEQKERQILLKRDFIPLVLPGDDILSVHIPTKTSLEPAACQKAFALAQDFFARYYPEKNIKAFYCRSWLMDPELSKILNPDSNIVYFQKLFSRYPFVSTGKEIFSFVHPQPFEKYEDLPENTTLMRGLKACYLNEKPIYVYAGVYIP